MYQANCKILNYSELILMLVLCTIIALIPALIQCKVKFVYLPLVTMTALITFCIWGGGPLYGIVFVICVPLFGTITWYYHKNPTVLKEEDAISKWTCILFNSLVASTVFIYIQLSWNTLPVMIYLRIKFGDYWYSTYNQSESALQIGTSILLASSISFYMRYRLTLDSS